MENTLSLHLGLLEFSVAQREGNGVRSAGFLLAENCFEPFRYQNLLSLAPGPGSGWVSPSWMPATKHSSGIGHGSRKAGCLAGSCHWEPHRPISWKDKLCCYFRDRIGYLYTQHWCMYVCVCVHERACTHVYMCIHMQ